MAIVNSATAQTFSQGRASISGAPLRWQGTNCVPITPDAAGSDDVADGSDLQAIERAARNWREATKGCAYLEITIHDPATNLDVRQDPKSGNVIKWIESDWPVEPRVSALTIVTFVDQKDHPENGRIADVDIIVNGEHFRFATDGSKDATDIENTLTHEFGHLMGFGHTCDDGEIENPTNNLGQPLASCKPVDALSSEVVESTMYNFTFESETAKRTPEASDVFGVCQTYPIEEDPQECQQAPVFPVPELQSGGCTAAARGMAPKSSGLIFAIIALSWLWRRTRFLFSRRG